MEAERNTNSVAEDKENAKERGAEKLPALFRVHLAAHVSFARHGRALAGESPEHAQVVGRIQPRPRVFYS